MKIENNGSEHIARAKLESANQVEGARPAATQPPATPKRDELALSEQAQSLSQARAAYQVLPEIRADKVGELKQSIQAGRYEVPHAALASRLLAIV